MKRRQAVTAAVGVFAGLAGCSGLQSRNGGVDLTIFNQVDTPYTIEIEFFGDGESEAAARGYDATLQIKA
jgi:spore maturation protein SpmB